jgi:hypothetical protein
MIWNRATKADHGHKNDNSDPPPSSPTPSPTKSRKNEALSIVFQHMIDPISNDNSWLFFKSAYGKSSVCRPYQEATKVIPTEGDVDNPPWPGGTCSMNNLIDGVECDYLNDGSNPGALFCQNWDAPPPTETEGPLPKNRTIECKEEVRRWDHGAEICSDGGDIFVAHHPVVSCDW